MLKPRFRGVSHFYAAFAAIAGGAVLLRDAPNPRAFTAAAIYAASLFLLFAISALYHCPTWSEGPRLWLRRLDHAGIYSLIAGTMTPLAMLLFEKKQGDFLLLVIWAAAAVGILLSVFWVHAPKWASAILYVSMGCLAAPYVPHFVQRLGVQLTSILVAGGAIYFVGAVIYARKRPNPIPGVFGYHEVFHLLVILAAMIHYFAIFQVIKRS